jgi:hypothetical protein
VQQFWDYDGEDKAKAIELSAEFLKVREAEMAAPAGKKKKNKGKGKK